MMNSLSTVIMFLLNSQCQTLVSLLLFKATMWGLGCYVRITPVWSGDDVAYTSSVVPCMTLGRRLIYAVFCLLRTHIILTERINFKKTYVTSIWKLIKTELRRSVLEDNIH